MTSAPCISGYCRVAHARYAGWMRKRSPGRSDPFLRGLFGVAALGLFGFMVLLGLRGKTPKSTAQVGESESPLVDSRRDKPEEAPHNELQVRDAGGPVLDRAHADSVRAALAAGWSATMPEPPTPARPTSGYREMPSGSDLASDAESPLISYVRHVMRDDYVPLARQCYDAMLERSPRIKGRISAFLVIVGDPRVGGVVESVAIDDEQTTLVDPEFRTCIRESLMSIAFDAPPGGRLTVGYPLEFAPDALSDGSTGP
jgi:hypothetical protein